MSLSVYAAIAAALLAAGGWGGYRLTANHYEARIAAAQHASDAALSQAQARVIAAQAAQAQALANAEKDYATLKDSNDTLASRLTDSLRRYAALRERPVSALPGAAAKPPDSGPFAASDSRIAELSGLAWHACLADAAELSALQEWAKALRQP